MKTIKTVNILPTAELNRRKDWLVICEIITCNNGPIRKLNIHSHSVTRSLHYYTKKSKHAMRMLKGFGQATYIFISKEHSSAVIKSVERRIPRGNSGVLFPV